MRILFDHPSAFMFAHGGFQIQIEQTKAALEKAGTNVEYLRWWDDSQKADIIHYFGRPSPGYLHYAQAKKIKVIMAPLLTGMGSRPRSWLFFQKHLVRIAKNILPGMITSPFGWSSFQKADACVALTSWEGHLMSYMFQAEPKRVHVIPNGVEEVFFSSSPTTRGQWLICTATITERKRVLELAQAAIQAKTPTWIVGKPYNEADPYAQRFLALARENPTVIRYNGPADRPQLAGIYRQARGFVLLSDRESLSLSALEAAASECPLLLSDLPWARTTFKNHASYCPIGSLTQTAKILRTFYDSAPNLPSPPKPMTWAEVAAQLKTVYAKVLSTAR